MSTFTPDNLTVGGVMPEIIEQVQVLGTVTRGMVLMRDDDDGVYGPWEIGSEPSRIAYEDVTAPTDPLPCTVYKGGSFNWYALGVPVGATHKEVSFGLWKHNIHVETNIGGR